MRKTFSFRNIFLLQKFEADTKNRQISEKRSEISIYNSQIEILLILYKDRRALSPLEIIIFIKLTLSSLLYIRER